MRLAYNPARGWFYTFDFRTGSVHFRTGQRYPTFVRGVELPEWVRCKFGPYPSAAEAAAVWR